MWVEVRALAVALAGSWFISRSSGTLAKLLDLSGFGSLIGKMRLIRALTHSIVVRNE